MSVQYNQLYSILYLDFTWFSIFFLFLFQDANQDITMIVSPQFPFLICDSIIVVLVFPMRVLKSTSQIVCRIILNFFPDVLLWLNKGFGFQRRIPQKKYLFHHIKSSYDINVTFTDYVNLDHLIKVTSAKLIHSYYFLFLYHIHFKQFTRSNTQSRGEKRSYITWREAYQIILYVY